MNKVLALLMVLNIGTLFTRDSCCCTCMGRIDKHKPAFFINEYESEQEIDEDLDVQSGISDALENHDSTTEENA